MSATASIVRRFDHRKIDKAQLLAAISAGTAEANELFGSSRYELTSDGNDFVVTWYPTYQPDLEQFARSLDRAVAVTNKEFNMADVPRNVTGASALGQMFRQSLAEIKAALDGAQAEMATAIGDLRQTATQATHVVKQVKAETADLKAALGLHTNSPPE
jgi:ABC-type transporter Mla subunit MlaD